MHVALTGCAVHVVGIKIALILLQAPLLCTNVKFYSFTASFKYYGFLMYMQCIYKIFVMAANL